MSNNEKFNALAALAENKPNLWRVAEEIAKRKKPDMVLNALQSVLSARERGGPEGLSEDRAV